MIDRKILANAIRFLSIDSVYYSQSGGHVGTAMGMADIAEVLWRDYMKFNPSNPNWINRDRFILSNGHSAILLYSILHLTGYAISIQDLKNYRKLFSKTPGHPEYGHTIGVEATTGPLGQGIANGVGLAIAEKTLGAQFNQKKFNIIDHHTYVFVGDGCMMEGISHEVCSLAGKLKLGKLIVIYDSNGISIDGYVKDYFCEDTAKRFNAYGWNVINNINGHDYKSIKLAFRKAIRITEKPTLIIFKTIIGYGSVKYAGSKEAHGSPFNKKDIDDIRKKLNWKYLPFEIPLDIYKCWNQSKIGIKKEEKWNEIFLKYQKEYPDLSKELLRRIKGFLPDNWNQKTYHFLNKLKNDPMDISTRKSSQIILEYFCEMLPELLGGSADLSNSNLTIWSGSNIINSNPNGNYIYYGVREFGMSAIMNGIALHGGFRPYGGTFLIFFEYACNAVRMAALMKINTIFVYTHDSIGLGEDGPTHQPIEQLVHLRNIPNISVWRPCDQIESFFAWKNAIERKKGPTVLVFSRQNLKYIFRNQSQLNNVSRGGYIIRDNSITHQPSLILIATGSEVNLAIEAYEKLILEGYYIRVISIPSVDIFESQDISYRESVLPSHILNRIVIEASTSNFWYKYVSKDNGFIIGVDQFGYSGSSNDLFNLFKINVNNIIKKSKFLLSKKIIYKN
ncbi:MAG: transketolase [Arsenophonus sp.]|nr:MAG: transketolase [Arsenophonus sp.]